MIAVEARWVRRAMAAIPDDLLFPLVNVGSQDDAFRRLRQPWIDGEVFSPLRARDGEVKHLDLMPGEGVDVVGDLLDPAVAAQLAGARSVLCANVLEHVPDRHRFAEALADIVVPGGYLIVTCPHRFPYHPDPIDTMYRPDVDELAALFPALQVEEGAVVGSLMVDYVVRRLIAWIRHGTGAAPPASSPAERPPILRWMFRRIEATCVVFRKAP